MKQFHKFVAILDISVFLERDYVCVRKKRRICA